MFKNVEGQMFDTINTIPDLKHFISIRSRTDVSASDAFSVTYKKRPELRAWDLDLQYRRSNPYTGYISFMIKNNTKGRLLSYENNVINFSDDGLYPREDLHAERYLNQLPYVEEYPYRDKSPLIASSKSRK
jgi:hypothetical protein